MAAPRSHGPRLARAVRRAVAWSLVFVAALVLALRWIGPDEAWAALQGVGLPVVTGVLGLSLVNYALRSLRWQLLCRHVAVAVPLPRNVLYYVAGFAFTITPGKLGEVVRLWFLERGHGYRYERTFGVMVLDRLTDAWPLLLLALFGVADVAGRAGTLAAMAAMLAVGTIVLLHPAWLAGLVRLVYGRVRRGPRLFARFSRASRMLARFASPGVLTLAMLLGVFGWLAEIAGAWLILDALGVALPLTTIAFVFGFGMLVGGLPLFPGGLGGAEVTIAGLLVLLGVPLPVAVAATALIRLVTLGFAVVLGFLALPLAIAASRPGSAEPPAA
jgi:uncharacterized protein (TIRG00374 family)